MVCILCLVFSVEACAKKSASLEFSGFLDSYKGLRPSPDESGAWSYRKPDANFKGYTKIMLNPLVIWPSRHSAYGGLDALTAWKLALAFQDRMNPNFALARFPFVSSAPRPYRAYSFLGRPRMNRRSHRFGQRNRIVQMSSGLPCLYGQSGHRLRWTAVDARVSDATALPGDAGREPLAPAAVQSRRILQN
jgi:hypothetical protein